MPQPDLAPLLFQALAARRGIVVSTNSVDILKARLYKTRQSLKESHPSVMDLTIQTSRQSPLTEVWIIKSNLKDTPSNE